MKDEKDTRSPYWSLYALMYYLEIWGDTLWTVDIPGYKLGDGFAQKIQKELTLDGVAL